jgi:hypothetical protein
MDVDGWGGWLTVVGPMGEWLRASRELQMTPRGLDLWCIASRLSDLAPWLCLGLPLGCISDCDHEACTRSSHGLQIMLWLNRYNGFASFSAPGGRKCLPWYKRKQRRHLARTLHTLSLCGGGVQTQFLANESQTLWLNRRDRDMRSDVV